MVNDFFIWESVPTPWGSFPALGIRAHTVGKLSSLGISCSRRGEAFQPWDFVPAPWGSFPALGIRAHAVGKLSSFGNPCPHRGEVFQLWESVPTLWGSFRSYLSWSLEEARQRLRIVGRFHRPWQISSAYDCKSGVAGCYFFFNTGSPSVPNAHS